MSFTKSLCVVYPKSGNSQRFASFIGVKYLNKREIFSTFVLVRIIFIFAEEQVKVQ